VTETVNKINYLRTYFSSIQNGELRIKWPFPLFIAHILTLASWPMATKLTYGR